VTASRESNKLVMKLNLIEYYKKKIILYLSYKIIGYFKVCMFIYLALSIVPGSIDIINGKNVWMEALGLEARSECRNQKGQALPVLDGKLWVVKLTDDVIPPEDINEFNYFKYKNDTFIFIKKLPFKYQKINN